MTSRPRRVRRITRAQVRAVSLMAAMLVPLLAGVFEDSRSLTDPPPVDVSRPSPSASSPSSLDACSASAATEDPVGAPRHQYVTTGH